MYETLTLVALFLAALWPGYQIYRQIRGPHLGVRLTTEVFFRISTGFGEAVFVKPVLLAENGNILVESVTGILHRTTPGSTKDWEIEFKRFGEVVRNPNEVLSNHYFHSSSPLQFLAQNVPMRAVYLGDLKGYSAQFMRLVAELSNKTIELQKTLPNRLTTMAITGLQNLAPDDQQKVVDASSKMSQLGQEYASKLVDQIQLEKGEYELTVTVEYRALGGIRSPKKEASSKIGFSVEEGARDRVKGAFPRALQAEMTNIVFGTTLQVVNPEYAPRNVKEM